MSKEIALDLRRYNTPEKLSTLPYDTASLAIEASSNKDLPRVNPTWLVLNNEKVIIPGKDKRDVSEMFVSDDNPETKAGLSILKELRNDPEDFIYTWISPSGKYPESRVQIGAKLTTKSDKYSYLKRYDISTSLSPEGCLLMGQLLASMSPSEISFPQQPGDLGGVIFKLNFPKNRNPFEYLYELMGQYIPEKDRFESILNGSADKNKAKAVKTAVAVTKTVFEKSYVIYSDPIGYGANIENQMRAMGFGMDPEKFGCGGSNTTLTSTNFPFTETSTPVFGIEDKYGSLQFSCPHCGVVNTRPFGQLISNCRHCGGDVRC